MEHPIEEQVETIEHLFQIFFNGLIAPLDLVAGTVHNTVQMSHQTMKMLMTIIMSIRMKLDSYSSLNPTFGTLLWMTQLLLQLPMLMVVDLSKLQKRFGF